jgi:protein-S-isoprenylcysteine O-methyltransferase Ste14
MSIKFVGSFARRGGWWVVAQFTLFAFIVVAFARNSDPGVGLRLVGWIMIGAAVVLGGAGLWMLRSSLTAMPAPLIGATLKEHGPYRLVRHPVYGAVILGFLGLSLRGGNAYATVLSLLLIPFFYAKTLHEERLLAEQFPEYPVYQRRVRRRLLPWLL